MTKSRILFTPGLLATMNMEFDFMIATDPWLIKGNISIKLCEKDYVVPPRPPEKVSREGLAGKYSSWWKGPFMIVKIFQSEYCGNKKHYTLLNLVNNHEYKADVMHLKPFYYDPDEVIPLSVALRDTTEHYV